MKFKVDENLPAEVAGDLRVLGHDSKTVFDQEMIGVDDVSLLERVTQEARVFLTMDKGVANEGAALIQSSGRTRSLTFMQPPSQVHSSKRKQREAQILAQGIVLCHRD